MYNNYNNSTKNYTSYLYLVVLHCPGADAKSFHNAMQRAQQDRIYTKTCNWTVPFVPSMPSDHGSETVLYETTTLPIYPRKPNEFLPSLPLRSVAHLALYLTFSQHKLPSVRTPFLDHNAASSRCNCSNPHHTRWWGHLVDLPQKN